MLSGFGRWYDIISILNYLFLFLHSKCFIFYLEGNTGGVENCKKKAGNTEGSDSMKARMIANASHAAHKF